MPDYMSKRSKEEKDKSARAVAKTIFSTTPTHGKPGSWGDKEPGTFAEEALEPELEIVGIIDDEAIIEDVQPEIVVEVPAEGAVITTSTEEPLEAESEHSAEELDVALSEVTTDAVATILNRDKEIAFLKAKLAELEK